MSSNLKKGILLMTISSLLTVIGQFLWKIGSSASSLNDFAMIFIGFSLYGIGSLFMIYSLKFGQLSILYPVMCTSYIFAIIVGYIFFDEKITFFKVIGTLLILVGVTYIGKGDEKVE